MLSFVHQEIDDLIRFPTPSAALLTYGGSPFSCDLSISGPVGYPYEGKQQEH
jgi:hypothetical protein